MVRQSKLRTLRSTTRLPSTLPLVIRATSSAQTRSFDGSRCRTHSRKAQNAAAKTAPATAMRGDDSASNMARLNAAHSAAARSLSALAPGARYHSAKQPQMASGHAITVTSGSIARSQSAPGGNARVVCLRRRPGMQRLVLDQLPVHVQEANGFVLEGR